MSSLFDLIPHELIRSIFLYLEYVEIKQLIEIYLVFNEALLPEIFWKQKLIHEFDTDQIYMNYVVSKSTVDTYLMYRSTYEFLHQLKYKADPFFVCQSTRVSKTV